MKIFLSVLLLLFFFKGFSTAQEADYLIIDKDTIILHSNPLNIYFEKNPISEELIKSRSSSNWRGYIAFFKFLDEKLVVENIYTKNHVIGGEGKMKYEMISIYKDVFGSNLNFQCNFYSGLLICPYGKILNYVHMGYSSLYEYYKIFELDKGKVVKNKDFLGSDFQNFKVKYFNYYKTTEEYRTKIKEYKQSMLEMNESLDDIDIPNKRKSKKKENKYLKEKEADFKAEKQADSFLFLFSEDYMKTLEIPKY